MCWKLSLGWKSASSWQSSLFRQSFLLIFLISCVLSEPIIIKSGLSRDHAQAKASDVLDSEVKKGDQNYVNQEGYGKNSEKKFVNAQDSGKYGQESEDKKQKEQQGSYGNQKFHKDEGANEANFGKKIGHKKNHHKTGFHNTYHKDESGSNSSYYDDSNDEADEYVHDNKKGAYGDSSSGQNRGSYHDRNGYAKQNAKHGGYNNGGSYDKEVADKNKYNQGKYYDNRYHKGQAKAGDRSGEQGHYAQERYTRPVYHTNYPIGAGGLVGGGIGGGVGGISGGVGGIGGGVGGIGGGVGGIGGIGGIGGGIRGGIIDDGIGVVGGGIGGVRGGLGRGIGGVGGGIVGNEGYIGGEGIIGGVDNYPIGGEGDYRIRDNDYYPRDDYHRGYQRNEYYQKDYNTPEKRVITVYEDPRVYQSGSNYNSYDPSYDSDRVRVDIRPPAFRQTRYYNHRPLYDDYY